MVSAERFLTADGEAIRWYALATTLVGGVLWSIYRIVISTWLGVSGAFETGVGAVESFLTGAVGWYGRIATVDFRLEQLATFGPAALLVGLLVVLATAYVIAWGWNSYV